jgi:hypothetical protein
MSHLICLHARAGGFATRWGENWFAEAAMNGRRMAMGSPTHPIDGRSHGTVAALPSIDGNLDRTVTPLPSSDGKSDGTAARLPSNDGKSHGTVTSGASIDRQSHRTGSPLLSSDGQLHKAMRSASSIDRIFESWGRFWPPKCLFGTFSRPTSFRTMRVLRLDAGQGRGGADLTGSAQFLSLNEQFEALHSRCGLLLSAPLLPPRHGATFPRTALGQ